MRYNFVSLTQQLLLTDNILDRITISHKIFELIELSVNNCNDIELVVREHFIECIKVCAVNPNSFQHSEIIEIAHKYRKNCLDFGDLHFVA